MCNTLLNMAYYKKLIKCNKMAESPEVKVALLGKPFDGNFSFERGAALAPNKNRYSNGCPFARA
ncbi:MAG: arginase family enzyme [Cognaticolwellia sp.]|jgi:arginase family enzyme